MTDFAASASLAETIDKTLAPVSDFVSAVIFYSIPVGGVGLPVVVLWLMSAATIFTVAFRFINLRGFRRAWSLVIGKGDKGGAGEISHFEALAAALSGTVGLGNIASVPVAIAVGGPGAVFWMMLAGFLGMSAKFAECALSVKYRRVGANGAVYGGPMYYIEAAFARLGMKTLGRAAAMFFAAMAIGGSISIFQINQSHAQFAHVTGASAPLVFGAVMAGLVALVILGGIRRIGRVSSVLVPLMGALYLSAGLVIIAMNAQALPGAVMTIFKSAFGFDAAGGGLVGALIAGVRRATFSNEAGVGSSAIAHAAVKTNEPLTEGYVALLEPFIDTIIVCSVTALVVIVTGAYEPFLYGDNIVGIEITSAAYESAFSWFPYLLLVASILFAFTTVVSWAYYGAQAAAYLFGATRTVDVVFKLALCLVLSTGAAVSLSSIIDFIDSMLFGMCIPNILALYLLLPELRRDLRAYEAKRL